ncbi:hypothetical protein AAEO50_19150 [Rossellomorea oryzaecorticis]|uniref:Uncharacterized protein n=1 Tax=Rossellomorea oryzaecorticis TaxID=1396505 RepID=A0ABU9KE65_9BACI
MKKMMLIVIALSIVSVLFFMLNRGTPIEHEELTKEEAPETIRKSIGENESSLGFQIFREGEYTYIYYKSEDAHDEYTTTDVRLRERRGKVVVTATVDGATNDGEVKYYELVRIHHVTEEDMILKERIDVP